MSDYSELERRAQAAIDAIGTLSRARQEMEFNDVCTPQVVLALIADLDEARNGMKHSCAIRLKKQIEHLEGERDQLRAEVAGLRTGYEAYERVNAELNAECEALRKHQPSTEVIWCACGDGYPANSYGAGFMDANNGVCANCDAAIGKGDRP